MKHTVVSFIFIYFSLLFVPLRANTVDLSHLTDANRFIALSDLTDVSRYVNRYLKVPEATEQLIGKTVMYFPYIDRLIQEYGLPPEVKYLTIIESTLNPKASSAVGAAGLWQLMPYTAKELGLRINSYIDERCDVEKSTQAALYYLSNLYEKYGDWALTMAAYNAGPGKVNKAIRLANSYKFESIRQFLPKETQQFIPKIIAAQYILENHAEYELNPILPELDFLFTSNVVLNENMKLSEVSEMTGVAKEIIIELNPALKQNYIPKLVDGFTLALPQRVVKYFMNNLETKEENWTFSNLEFLETKVTIKKLSSIFELGRIYRIDPYFIKNWNFLKSHQLDEGQELILYSLYEKPDVLEGEPDPTIFTEIDVPTKIPSAIVEKSFALAYQTHQIVANEKREWEIRSKN